MEQISQDDTRTEHFNNISSVYSPFSVLMRSIGAEFLQPDALPGVNYMRGMQYEIVINVAFCPKLKYKFVCTIPTQNINLHSIYMAFSRLLRHIWVKAVMQF